MTIHGYRGHPWISMDHGYTKDLSSLPGRGWAISYRLNPELLARGQLSRIENEGGWLAHWLAVAWHGWLHADSEIVMVDLAFGDDFCNR